MNETEHHVHRPYWRGLVVVMNDSRDGVMYSGDQLQCVTVAVPCVLADCVMIGRYELDLTVDEHHIEWGEPESEEDDEEEDDE